jgi:hypothetical protein
MCGGIRRSPFSIRAVAAATLAAVATAKQKAGGEHDVPSLKIVVKTFDQSGEFRIR